MTFVHPAWLWLLLAGIPLVALHVRGFTPFGPARKWALAGLRVLGLVLLVLALAQPVIYRPDSSTTTVLVADCSASVSDADLVAVDEQIGRITAARRPSERIRLVTFDTTAREVSSKPESLITWRHQRSAGTQPAAQAGSALADALDLAALLIPHEGRGRVLLFSDGRETRGDARAAAWRLGQRGIVLEAVTVGQPCTREVLLERVELPATAGIGSSVEVKATVQVAEAGSVVLEVKDTATGEIQRREQALEPGRHSIAVPIALQRRGLCEYAVRVSGGQDTLADNNELAAAIEVLPPLRVRVVEDNPAGAAAAALREMVGPAAEISTLDVTAPGLAETLADTDVLVLADCMPETVPAPAQEAIRDAVTRGMGLLMTGGRRAFGPARLSESPLAEVVPVRLPQGLERRDPSATLVIIIDTSGSMTGARVSLAKEIARLALARLKPHDKAGIVEFYGSKRWAAPIQSAANAIDLQRALNRLSAGGGTVILPALEEAYYALRDVNTRTKHVLVLTDGGVETGAFEPLIRKMTDHNITLSTVLVGPGTHSAFLASLAHWGRGRFYTAPDRFNLPEIIVKQPENSLSLPYLEQSVSVVAGRRDRWLDGIDVTAWPSLSGYVETVARPTADVLLATDSGQPLLAKWQYGLGVVAAWTSQLGGEWASGLSQSPSAGRLFSNVLRGLAGRRPEQALRIDPVCRAGALELEINNLLPQRGILSVSQAGETPAPQEVASCPLEIVVRRRTGSPDNDTYVVRKWTVDPYAPHRWNLRIADLDTGVYEIEARAEGTGLTGTAAVVINAPPEVAALGPDKDLMEDLVNLAGQLAAGRAGELPRKAQEIWPVFAALFVPVLLLHVLIRRWPSRMPAAVAVTAAVLMVTTLGSPEAAAQLNAASTATAPSAADLGRALAEVRQTLSAGDSARIEAAFADARDTCLATVGSLEPLVECLEPLAALSRDAAWLLAQAARDDGDLITARDLLAALTEREPGRFEWWAERARVEEWLGNDEGALTCIDRALACPCEPAQRSALLVRAAALQRDSRRMDDLSRSLDAVAAADAGGALGHMVGHYAGLLGDPERVVRYLAPRGERKDQFHDYLFRGLALLRLNRPADAREEYEEAYQAAPLERDRRFALERVIASARRGGNLHDLAEEWWSDPDLTPDRLQALVAVLAELGESKRLLDLLDRLNGTASYRELIESPEFQTQIITAAIASGDLKQAESAYRQLVERYPQQIQWRIGLARLWLLGGQREQATRFLMEAVESFEDSSTLMGLAQAAAALSLDSVAVAASDKAAKAGLPQQIRAGLFQAGLVRQRGDADRALNLVRQLVPAARQDPKLLQSVAETLERHGDKTEALHLYRELHETTGTEDTLQQLAYLLEQNEKFEEAYELWRELWSTTQVPARSKQAESRMLDLASRTGKLADMVIEIEERLATNSASPRDLELLVKIYTAAQDPVSAAEVLQEYAAKGRSEVELLQWLARVYLDGEQFGRCSETFRRLIELDPANAADYLQQVAILAMERKQPLQARRALAELQALSGGQDDATDEFAAGVLDMTGQHAEAARAYRRVLNTHPDRIESWLLWGNAMKASGRGDQAIARFQVLVEESVEDDLFTIAVDGLLNLQAKPAALRSALRRVYARIAANPQKVFLYQLASDLLDGLNEAERARDIVEQAVVVGGERRAALLRELMESAKSANKIDEQIEYGRSLLALADALPPQVFLDLGEALLKKGELHLAERVFERASIDGDYSAIQQRVASYYEEANRPADADRIIRGLLIAEPDSVPLLVRSGSLNEQMGNHAEAFAQYYRATDLMLRRLPGYTQHDVATRPIESERSRIRVVRASNMDEITQYFESAGNGLIGTARTPELRERLERDLVRRIREEVAVLSANGRLMPRIAANPRLERLARFLRQVAFSLHVPQIADEIDRELLARYPKDTTLRQQVVTSRVEWGLNRRAAEMAGLVAADNGGGGRKVSSASQPAPVSQAAPASGPATSGPAAGAVAVGAINPDLVLADPQLIDEVIASGQISAELAHRLIPVLLMQGRHEQVRRVLACAAPPDAKEAATVCGRMMAAAIALDDTAAVQRWLGLWLDRSPQVTAGQNTSAAAGSIERCVRLAFRVLDPSQRFGLVERLGRICPRLDARNRLAVRFLQMDLCDVLDMPFADIETLASEIADTDLSVGRFVQVLERLPADKQVAFFRQAVSARKPADQRSSLLDVVGLMSRPAGPELQQAILELLRTTPKRKLTSGAIRIWPRNARQPELVLAIAEQLLAESPEDPAVLVATALARENAGRHEEAAVLAREAMDLLMQARQVTSDEWQLFNAAVGVLRPAELEKYAADLAELHEIEAPTPVQMFMRGLVLRAMSRDAEAVAAFRQAYDAQPSNRVFSRALVTALKETGRTVELARTLAATLTSSTIMESFEWRSLSEAYYELCDPVAALLAAQKDETILAPVGQIRALQAMGREDEALAVFRRMFIRNRDKGFYLDLTWPQEPGPGGLLGHGTQEDEVPVASRRKLFDVLAGVSWAKEEYSVLLEAARPGRRDVEGLISGLINVARLNDGWGRLAAKLEAARQADAITCNDQALLIELASQKPEAVSDGLLAEIDQIRLQVDPADSKLLWTIARVYQARGRTEAARHLLQWMLVSGLEGQGGVGLSQRLAHLDAYIQTLPPEERGPQLRRWLGLMQPTGLDPLTNEFGIECADRLKAAGDERWRELLESLRKRADSEVGDIRYRLLRTALARRYAAMGNLEVFTEQVRRVLDPAQMDDLLRRAPDPRSFLPVSDALEQPAAFVDVVRQRVDELYRDGRLPRDHRLRMLCLLGDWCRERKLAELADAIVRQCEVELGDPCTGWLYVADLDRRLGREDEALALEFKLLESDLLPVARVPDVLNRLEARQGRAAADSHAVRVAEYSRHPDVLTRAIRHARTTGDTALVDHLEQKLEEIQPRTASPASEPAAVP